MNEIELLCGDCLELLPEVPDNSVDMILCDLPYGITQNSWDVALPLDPLFHEYRRIVKSRGVIALFGQMPFSADLVNAYRKGFRYEWIWQKGIAGGFLNANKMPLRAHESILIFYDKLPKYNPQMRTGFKPYQTTTIRGRLPIIRRDGKKQRYRPMWTIFGTVLVSAGIPTAVLGFLFSRLNHRMDKTDAQRKEQEAAKLKSDTMLINWSWRRFPSVKRPLRPSRGSLTRTATGIWRRLLILQNR